MQERNVLILVALLFTLTSVTVAQQLPISGTEPERVGHTIVTVTDKYGRFVSGLSKDQITIWDEKTPQEIVAFEQQDEPFSLVVLFDVSSSIPADGVDTARAEFLQLVETGNKSSDYAIIAFSEQASMLTEFTRDKSSLVAGINKVATLKRTGASAFYDAFNLALEKAQTAKQKKRIILLISDGDNNYSNSQNNDLREKLKGSDVLVYAMGFSEPRGIGRDLPWAEPGIPSRLITLCSVTGGVAYYPRNSADLKSYFEGLGLELKTQYSVIFRPSSFVKDGEWRRLKYKAAPPNTPGWEKVTLAARGREGYFLKP
ncbi:MAG TPA: VWA domain-containing protein [Pyrinomonadaceae bacterium]|nr:VWA domain-containing protein [Pyrinomonadaceae bacterium]